MTDELTLLRRSRVRYLCSMVAMLACLPYLTLKICWVAGLPIGWIDPSAVDRPGFAAGNVPTLGMDAVVVLLALALVAPWGKLVPGWLMVFPVWIGTGFLVPIPLVMGASALLSPVVGAGASVVTNSALEDWVPVVVYGGFTLQGIGLLAGFVLYARARWPRLFVLRMGERWQGPASAALVIISAAGALAAVGSRLGLSVLVVLSDADDPRRLVIDRTGAVVGTVLVCAGVGATLALVARRTRGHTRFAIPMIISWIGIAVVLVDSLFGLMGDLVSGEPTLLLGLPAESLLQLLGVVGGLMLGMVGAIVLAENSGAALRQAQEAEFRQGQGAESHQARGAELWRPRGADAVRLWCDPDSDFTTPKGGVNIRGK